MMQDDDRPMPSLYALPLLRCIAHPNAADELMGFFTLLLGFTLYCSEITDPSHTSKYTHVTERSNHPQEQRGHSFRIL